jgi:hypothetical protein
VPGLIYFAISSVTPMEAMFYVAIVRFGPYVHVISHPVFFVCKKHCIVVVEFALHGFKVLCSTALDVSHRNQLMQHCGHAL